MLTVILLVSELFDDLSVFEDFLRNLHSLLDGSLGNHWLFGLAWTSLGAGEWDDKLHDLLVAVVHGLTRLKDNLEGVAL